MAVVPSGSTAIFVIERLRASGLSHHSRLSAGDCEVDDLHLCRKALKGSRLSPSISAFGMRGAMRPSGRAGARQDIRGAGRTGPAPPFSTPQHQAQPAYMREPLFRRAGSNYANHRDAQCYDPLLAAREIVASVSGIPISRIPPVITGMTGSRLAPALKPNPGRQAHMHRCAGE